jgi:hypothetical protein
MSLVSSITSIVPISTQEIVRARIAEILAVELANQKILIEAEIDLEELKPTPDLIKIKELNRYLDSIPAVIYEERVLPPDVQDMPYLNIYLNENMPIDAVSDSTMIGITKFTIESWQSSVTIGSERGDKNAAVKLQRLINACVKIIMDRKYKFLALDSNIGHRQITRIATVPPQKNPQLMDNEMYGVIEMSVKISDGVPTYNGVLLDRNTTKVEINDKAAYTWII